MSSRKLTRRDAGQLISLGLAGWGVSQVLQAWQPLGRDVSRSGAAQLILSDRSAPSSGPANANLTIAVFTDYQCPACRKAHFEMERALSEDGRVRVLYKDWPIFGRVSERAARVALAADRQGIYAQVHGRLMTRVAALNDATLEAAVIEAGGDWQRIINDLSGFGRVIDLQLAVTRGQVFSLNISGTPAYLIGDQLIEGALTQRQFRRAFAAARS
jgi:protein-disulfide isomerase